MTPSVAGYSPSSPYLEKYAAHGWSDNRMTKTRTQSTAGSAEPVQTVENAQQPFSASGETDFVLLSDAAKKLVADRKNIRQTMKDGTQVSIEPAWSMDEQGNKAMTSATVLITAPDGTTRKEVLTGSATFSRASDGTWRVLATDQAARAPEGKNAQAADGVSPEIVVNGTEGDDIIIVFPSGDNTRTTINAGNGDNIVVDLSGNSHIVTGDGDDVIVVSGKNVTTDVHAGSGNDSITVLGNFSGGLDGGAGDDTISVVGLARGTINGGDGNDAIRADSASGAEIKGGQGDDSNSSIWGQGIPGYRAMGATIGSIPAAWTVPVLTVAKAMIP